MKERQKKVIFVVAGKHKEAREHNNVN